MQTLCEIRYQSDISTPQPAPLQGLGFRVKFYVSCRSGSISDRDIETPQPAPKAILIFGGQEFTSRSFFFQRDRCLEKWLKGRTIGSKSGLGMAFEGPSVKLGGTRYLISLNVLIN